MKTSIKYANLAKLPDQSAQMKALAKAVNFELALPGVCIDLLGSKAALGRGGQTQRYVPSIEQIKAYFANKYATPDTNPIVIDIANRTAEFFHSNMPEIDTGWPVLFDLVDLRGTSQDHFDLINTSAGIGFSRVEPGGKIAVRREFTEAETTVKFLTYGAGLGIQDDWLKFNQFWRVDQAIGEFRANYWDTLASAHYGLFTALGAGIDEAFVTDDNTTFNNACASILRNVRTSGYAAGQNAQFDILCAPEHQGRILKMLESTRGSNIVAFSATRVPIAYSVRNVIASTWIPANSTGYYLVLAGRKIKRGLWQDLQIESNRDIYARTVDWVASMQFNAIIGDSNQVRRVKFN